MKHIAFLITLLLICSPLAAADDQVSTEQVKFFEMHVRPLLAKHCLECHSSEKQKGMLRLDSRAAMIKGGESEEPAIVAGKPDESPIISAVRNESLEMPPKGKLPAKDIAVPVKWIELGAPYDGVDLFARSHRQSRTRGGPTALLSPPHGQHASEPERHSAISGSSGKLGIPADIQQAREQQIHRRTLQTTNSTTTSPKKGISPHPSLGS